MNVNFRTRPFGNSGHSVAETQRVGADGHHLAPGFPSAPTAREARRAVERAAAWVLTPTRALGLVAPTPIKFANGPREALEELQNLMAGGKELQDLSADLGGTV